MSRSLAVPSAVLFWTYCSCITMCIVDAPNMPTKVRCEAVPLAWWRGSPDTSFVSFRSRVVTRTSSERRGSPACAHPWQRRMATQARSRPVKWLPCGCHADNAAAIYSRAECELDRFDTSLATCSLAAVKAATCLYVRMPTAHRFGDTPDPHQTPNCTWWPPSAPMSTWRSAICRCQA